MAGGRLKHTDKRGRKRNEAPARGVVDQVLAPVASLVVLASAAVRAMADGRAGDRPAAATRAPGPTGRSAQAGGRDEDDGEQRSGIHGRLQRLGRRFPPLGRALDVQKRFVEVRGNSIAAAVTLQAFLSLFPLILVTVAVVGFLQSADATDVAGRIISGLGLQGDAATVVTDAVGTAERSRKAATLFGLAGLLWTGLGLVDALQHAFNQVWQVQERGIKDKAVGMLWLMGAALLLVAVSILTTLLRWLPGVLSPAGILLSLVVNVALWLLTAKVLPNRDVGWRALLPGALLGGVGVEVLKVVGAFYVPRAVSSSSQLYGSLGGVFAILAWLLFFGRLIVYSAILNVVLWERGRGGTVTATIEVPATPGATPDDVTRSGRVQKEDQPERAPA